MSIRHGGVGQEGDASFRDPVSYFTFNTDQHSTNLVLISMGWHTLIEHFNQISLVLEILTIFFDSSVYNHFLLPADSKKWGEQKA